STAITVSELWRLEGAPHVVDGRVQVGGPGGVTVTIEPGVAVLFGDSAGLTFGIDGVGSLVAQGSASAPITMRSARAASVPGAWIGLTFRGQTPSELRYVNLSGCGGPRNDEQPAACVVLGHPWRGSDPTLRVESVTVENAAGAAMILQGESRFAPGSVGLTVRDVRGHVATLPGAA